MGLGNRCHLNLMYTVYFDEHMYMADIWQILVYAMGAHIEYIFGPYAHTLRSYIYIYISHGPTRCERRYVYTYPVGPCALIVNMYIHIPSAHAL
jgi:hypothetical protein